MSKLRLIQCGVGKWGKSWWSTATGQSPDFDLVAVVDIDKAALDEAGDALKLPPERRFESLEAALTSAPPDAILTVTPPAVHAVHARLALERGLHVMTEKPIADTLANAQDMVQLARAKGLQLVISQQYRYRPMIQKLKQLVADKVVGEFGHAHIDFYIPADFTGSFRETMEFPLLVDMAIHHVDLVRAITGRDILKVTAHTFNPAWSWYGHHAGLKMLMELEGSLPVTYSGDWSAKGHSTSWNATWRVQCAEGSIHLEDDKLTLWRCERWNDKPRSEAVEIPPLPVEGQAAVLANFANAIRTSKPAETSGEDNLRSFAAVIAGVASAREQRTVTISELLR